MPIAMTHAKTFCPGDGCFAAGTLVRTIRGTRPIEMLRAGDEVVTLRGVAKVLVAHRATAFELVRLQFTDGTSVVSTPWHRFFGEGDALVKAEDLRRGVVRITRVEPGNAHRVFNLTLDRAVAFYANGKLVEAGHASAMHSFQICQRKIA